ncbi:putative Polycomb protein VEFS-Box domain-containing protein [Seiridium unicorne]|uniref:Polycomb protein VEFS-Box domain-containing protein n=1 Tax=Seiridium unicorne TaxID=138068 RepID=A0ABR2VCB0_9PEZI
MSASIPYKRDSPFLHRVWRSAVDILGGPGTANGEKPGTGKHSPRATKRRRITEDSLDPGVIAAVGPLFTDPSKGFTRALRVQVLRLGRDYVPDPGANGLLHGNGSPLKKDIPAMVIRARCKLTIFKYRPGIETRPMYCDSQPCEVKVFRDSDGVCRQARIYLRQPFHIAAEKLYVVRDDAQGFMLADGYLIQTELESIGDPNWPPFDLLPDQDRHRTPDTPPQQWVISSTFSYTYSKPRATTPVTLRKATGVETETDLAMETDLRWSTPANQAAHHLIDYTSKDSTPHWNGALAPLTNGHVNGRVDTLTNGLAHHDEDDVAADEEDGEGEATTPSRSLRMRGKQQNYNLKLLSDKARGKELKERKKRKDAKARDVGQVTWVMPVKGHVVLENWTCVRCFVEHSNIEQLKEHITQHIEFKFTSDFSPRGGWRIAVSRHGQETPRATRTAEFHEVSSQDELDYDSAAEHSPVKATSRGRPKPAPGKRTLSQVTRIAKQTIPDTKQPVYDRLSKAVLKPNSVVDEPPLNNSWLLQKHRDIIKDYTDVHADEKEYISEWDIYSLTRRATPSPHLNEIYLEFIEDKALWLASSQNRMNEAMKHLAYLNAREALEKSTISKALDILKTARSQIRRMPAQAQNMSQNSETYASKSGCAICGQPAARPNELICANTNCLNPFYHDDCARNEAKMPVDSPSWRCNECCENEAAT